jgi:hypothetical protein
MSEVTIPEQDTELFNGEEYRVPFPQVDEKEVTNIALRLGGGLELNRHDPEHVALVESLSLGRMISLTVTASVDAKGQVLKQDAYGKEKLTHTVALRIHEVEPA